MKNYKLRKEANAMGYFLTGLICLIIGGLVGAGLMWWFGVHKKKIPDVTTS